MPDDRCEVVLYTPDHVAYVLVFENRGASAGATISHPTDLPTLDDAGWAGLATILVDVLERFDRLFDAQTSHMLWIHQRPFDGGDPPQARLRVEIVTPWRAPHVTRYIAACELGSGVYFNPILPEEAAQSLRDALQ
jgi:UDPglucose--hexose-1-phosphate uridylyltransferase